MLCDSETDVETDWLVETEALVLDDSLSDIDSLVETEALNDDDNELDTD